VRRHVKMRKAVYPLRVQRLGKRHGILLKVQFMKLPGGLSTVASPPLAHPRAESRLSWSEWWRSISNRPRRFKGKGGWNTTQLFRPRLFQSE
jgi:hypothetical protein